jgi:hypothetical protein
MGICAIERRAIARAPTEMKRFAHAYLHIPR